MNITEALYNLVKEKNVKFIFGDKPITYEEVFAATGLLPAIARRADKLCLLCLGYGIGVTFVETEESILGVKVQFDEVTPNVLRLMYLYDVVMEIIKTSPSQEQVMLDELMYD